MSTQNNPLGPTTEGINKTAEPVTDEATTADLYYDWLAGHPDVLTTGTDWDAVEVTDLAHTSTLYGAGLFDGCPWVISIRTCQGEHLVYLYPTANRPSEQIKGLAYHSVGSELVLANGTDRYVAYWWPNQECTEPTPADWSAMKTLALAPVPDDDFDIEYERFNSYSYLPPPMEEGRRVEVFLNRQELAKLPEPEPLIHQTFDMASVGLLVGDRGTGKSFLALDWAASIAMDVSWHGRSVERHRVLYVAAEGAYGLNQRLDAWEIDRAVDIDPAVFMVLRNRIHLGHPLEVAALCQIITEQDFGYVVIDTLSKCMPGLDENASKEMSVVVDALYAIQRATRGGEGTVLANHHTGKDKETTRGSSALEDGVDFVYLIKGNATDLTLTNTKRKDGPEYDPMRFKLCPVERTDSCVLGSFGFSDMTRAEDKLLDIYREHFSATGCTKVQLRGVADDIGVPSKTFYRHFNALVESGELVNAGSEKSPVYREPPRISGFA